MAAHGGAESTGSAAGSLSAPCVRVAASSTMRRASQHCSVAGLGGGPELSTQGEEARVPPAGSAPATSRKWGHDSPEGRRAPSSRRKWARHEPEVGAPQAGSGCTTHRKGAPLKPEVGAPRAGSGPATSRPWG